MNQLVENLRYPLIIAAGTAEGDKNCFKELGALLSL